MSIISIFNAMKSIQIACFGQIYGVEGFKKGDLLDSY
jgi:hypothetical protein